MEEEFLIPINDAVEAFRHHLDSHDRTILSARFGDGKSFFLSHFMEDVNVKEQYTFLTIFPVNYQVAENRDIFELIKRDILLQMLLKGVIETDVKIPNEVALALYLQNEPLGFAESFLPLLSEYALFDNAAKTVAIALAGKKLFKTIKQKLDEVKKKSRAEQLETFLNAVEQNPVVGQDAISYIIQQCIGQYKKTHPGKHVVLVIEDLDRIDPAHLFRILNVFSAHIDFCYRFGCKPNETLAGNKFSLDKVVFVMDYKNVQSIYSHFYGERTDFEGYIEKFCSSNHFSFSLQELRDNYFLMEIEKVTGLESCILKYLIQSSDFQKMSVRKVVNAFKDSGNSIVNSVKAKNNDGQTIILHSGILRLIAIFKKLGIEETEIIRRLKRTIEIDGISHTGLFMYIAPFLNLAKYGNVKGKMRFVSSTNQLNTYHVEDILNDGKAFCNFFISLNFDETAGQDLVEQLKRVLQMVSK